MGGECKQPCERKCQVWQLALGGESNPTPHFHMPCLPGGGKPGGGLQLRTYEGGCRSVCSGSVRHPVEHLYPAGRMKKWFSDTKEWVFDGIFVMKTENLTKSASHYCLPFPRPTMRLPRACNSRLVEVHHVHPPPPRSSDHEAGYGKAPPQNAEAKTAATPPQTPSQHEGSEAAAQLDGGGSDRVELSNGSSGHSESSPRGRPQSEAFGRRPMMVADPTVLNVNIEAGSPPANPGEPERQGGGGGGGKDFTIVKYRASSLCSRIGRRLRCQGTNLDAVATTAVDVKELVNCYVFVADMPGLKMSEIKVQVENDSVLKLSGEQMHDDYAMEETEIKYIQVERQIGGRFIRKFNLPADTNLDGISAACQDGLLTVIVPKNSLPDPLRPRSFDVDVRPTSVSPPQTTPQR